MDIENENEIFIDYQDYQDEKTSSASLSLCQNNQFSTSHRQSTDIVNESNSKEDEKRKQIVALNFKPILQDVNSSINLFTGLQITSDGVIRYFPTINQVYFGFNQQKTQEVEEFHNIGVVNVKFEMRNMQRRSQFKQAFNFVEQIPDIEQQQAQESLKRIEMILKQMQSVMKEDSLAVSILEYKEDEFKSFQKMCMNFLIEYNKNIPFQMYSYTISRISHKNKDLQFSHQGYSKAYLDLLGIDAASLAQIILRGKQIDLIQRKYEISNLAIQGLSKLGKSIPEEVYISEIVTFDGFPVRLISKIRDYGKLLNNTILMEGEQEYQFTVTEMDVDLHDLKQLIQYRQRIVNNPQNLNIDDFIRKELSYLFEDVEYSIHSQSFIEKYYKDNLLQLEQQKHQINKQCNYKSIHLQ